MKRALLIGMAVISGCVSARDAHIAGVHSALNTITDVAQPAIDMTITACDASEGLAISRAITRAEARAAVAKVREVCDGMLAAFRALAELQMAARALVIRAKADGEIEIEDVSSALARLTAVHSRVLEDIEYGRAKLREMRAR